jgi:hypothetical protein
MTWTVEDRDKAIVKSSNEKSCDNCKYRAMDKTGCNAWCCDVENNDVCYQHEPTIQIFTIK